MIELYHWEPVAHSARVLICLNEIGAEFESHYVDLLEFEQFDDAFRALNPAGQVPVLCNNGVAMTESALINEYLAEAFPDAGLAAMDAGGWYRTQTWSKWVDYNLSSSLGTLGCRKFLVPELAARDRASLARAIDAIPVAERQPGWRLAADNAYTDDMVANSERKVKLVIGRMEEILAESEWLAGGAYSIADIDTFAMVDALRDVAPGIVNAAEAPATMRWLERIAARPAVQAARAANRKFETGTMYAPGPEHSRWG